MEETLRTQMHQKEKDAIENAYAAARKGDIYSAYEYCDRAIKARAASGGISSPWTMQFAQIAIIQDQRHWDKLCKVASEAAESDSNIRKKYEESLIKLEHQRRENARVSYDS